MKITLSEGDNPYHRKSGQHGGKTRQKEMRKIERKRMDGEKGQNGIVKSL